MNIFTKCILFSLSLFSLVFTCLTLFHFTQFISDIPLVSCNTSAHQILLDKTDEDPVLYATQATVIDISLLCIFIIQHSSLLPIQDFLSETLRLPVLNRSFLNLFTSASLQLLMHLWRPIPQYAVWVVSTEEPSRQLGFITVHLICWLLIYILMITMDITDFLGIKQVYYQATGRPAPATLKSQQLKSLHKKVRHPSFLGFLMIFWIHPFMRLDRLLLAVVWSLYMAVVWRPGVNDYNYVIQQQAAKRSVM
ncbi:nurim isoform X1 [Homalodisca vitripennis]|uniref:nurim isoform X1 n=2 Tax=Homalodisca vitripennis TaxID=197043 RepID=UPI001EEB1685|nr:nurim isoform X1 [Homalodisca vitripennis]